MLQFRDRNDDNANFLRTLQFLFVPFLKKYNKNHYFVYLSNGAFYGPHIPSSACCFFTSYSSFSSSSSPSSQNHNLFFFLALFWRLFGDFGNYFILCWYTPVTLYLFQQKKYLYICENNNFFCCAFIYCNAWSYREFSFV